MDMPSEFKEMLRRREQDDAHLAHLFSRRPTAQFDLPSHLILLTVTGSRAVNLHTENSDVDLLGVVVPPAKDLYGFLDLFERAVMIEDIALFKGALTTGEQEATARDERDGKPLEGNLWMMKRFCQEALTDSWVLSLLFCRPDEVRILTKAGRELRDHRQLFVSEQAAWSFMDRAALELRQLRQTAQWFLVPDEENRNYRGWQHHRNPSRAADDARLGFTAKHALHIFRCARTAREILLTGEVNVWREDREDIFAQLHSEKWTPDSLGRWLDDQRHEMGLLTSIVPADVNMFKLNDLCVRVTQMAVEDRAASS